MHNLCSRTPVRRAGFWVTWGLLSVLVPCWAAEKTTPLADVPWPLRDHLTFSMEKASLMYDIETAQWRFEVPGPRALLDKVAFAIVLEDGTTITAADLGKASLEREALAEGAEKGKLFSTVFPDKNGLAVRIDIAAYSDQPFLEFRLSVRNASDAPISIAEIRPVVFGPDCMQPLSAATGLVGWPFSLVSGAAVFSKEAGATLTVIHDPLEDVCLALGILPKGVADSSGEFLPSGTSWQGAIHCRFTPPVPLAPGATLEADPIWISYGGSKPAEVWHHYAWVCQGLPGMKQVANPPRAWATTPDSASATDLYNAARAWAPAGVHHALVPGSWEGRPGSLEGATPRYPKDMKKVVAELASLSMTPGLTIDPLAVQEGSDAWTALSVDGQRWLNASSEQARAFGTQRIKTLVDWGFKFIVIQPSAIPDEVLRHFGMTRTQAYRSAFDMARAAAPDLPVLPAAKATLRAETAGWLEAASSTSVLRMYQAGVGPVRLDVAGGTPLNDEVLVALRLFGGTVELVGKPEASSLESWTAAFNTPRLDAYPVDVTAADCRVWHAWIAGSGTDKTGERVIAFPGSLPWTIEDLRIAETDGLRLWRAADGALLATGTEPIASSERLQMYGLVAAPSRPMLLGVADSAGVLLDDVSHLNWVDDGKGESVLSGKFDGESVKEATAFVTIPEGWAFRSGAAGNQTISKKGVLDLLAFKMAPRQAAPFELRFKRGVPGSEPAEPEPVEAAPPQETAPTAASAPSEEPANTEPSDQIATDESAAQPADSEPAKETKEPGINPGKRVWRGLKGAVGRLF